VRLDRDTVASWLDEATASDPLPDLRVNPSEPDLLERSVDGLHEAPSFEEHDPGCYLFFLDRSDPHVARRNEAFDLAALTTQIAVAARESNRRLAAEWESAADDIERGAVSPPPQLDDFGSYIILASGVEVPTIGPGGHIFIEERAGTIAGSASVRPFVESPHAGSWTSADTIFAELAQFLSSGLEFFPALGYYEGSWMERQDIIRPTIAFVIETAETAPYPERWVVTMSATSTGEPPEPFGLR
jgi:hypothetical protein